MTDLYTSSENMQKAWRGVQESWETARDSWKDVDRDQFERGYIHGFEDTVGRYIPKLNALADTIARARKEVP